MYEAPKRILHGNGALRQKLTLHRFYQEFLGKSLTEKYTSLSTQMDKVIHNANSEISALHKKISGT